jgi:hypothetical protein
VNGSSNPIEYSKMEQIYDLVALVAAYSWCCNCRFRWITMTLNGCELFVVQDANHKTKKTSNESL